jgi:hypothetical protein
MDSFIFNGDVAHLYPVLGWLQTKEAVCEKSSSLIDSHLHNRGSSYDKPQFWHAIWMKENTKQGHLVAWVLDCSISIFGWKFDKALFWFSVMCWTISMYLNRFTLLPTVKFQNVFYSESHVKCSWFCKLKSSFRKTVYMDVVYFSVQGTMICGGNLRQWDRMFPTIHLTTLQEPLWAAILGLHVTLTDPKLLYYSACFW